MPILKSSIKDVRRTQTRTLKNKAQLTIIKGYIKKIRNSKSSEEAKNILKMAISSIDKASKTIFHKNKSARLKANLLKLFRSKYIK